MMAKSRLARIVAKKLPGLIPMKGNIFVNGSPEHVLCGYSLEYAPSGAWIWRFVYPLCDRSDSGIHLTYSHRLPGEVGHLSREKFSPDQMIDEFISRVSEDSKTALAKYSIDDFCAYCEQDAGIVRNKHTALGLAYAFVLAGNKTKAINYLEYSIPKLSEPDASEARGILELVRTEPAQAVDKILVFEKEMRLRLDLNF